MNRILAALGAVAMVAVLVYLLTRDGERLACWTRRPVRGAGSSPSASRCRPTPARSG